MSVRRSIVVLSLVMLLFPAAFFALRAQQAADAPDPAATLQLLRVGRGAVDVTVSAVGRVEPDEQSSLSVRAPGTIVEIRVQVGDQVRAGDVLLTQDDAAQRLALDQAQAALDLARLQRDQLGAGPDSARLAAAQAAVQAAQGAANAAASAVSAADVQTAQLNYDAAQQALADAQAARASAAGGQPQAAYDLLEARIGQASFNAEIARLQLEQVQSGSPSQVGAAYAQVAQAQAQLDQLLAGPTEAQLAAADARVAQAQIQVDAAQRAVDETRLTAPFDGVITAVNAEAGALAAPGLPLLSVMQTEPLWLTVQVDEIDVREVAEGMQARVVLDALPDVTLDGVLDRIGLTPQNQNGIVNYDVRVRLQGADPRARVGMTAEASFIVQQVQDVLIVPNAFIRLDRQRNQAFVNRVLPDGTLEEVEVQLGLQGRDDSQVLSGLAEDDLIAVDLAGDSLSLFGG